MTCRLSIGNQTRRRGRDVPACPGRAGGGHPRFELPPPDPGCGRGDGERGGAGGDNLWDAARVHARTSSGGCSVEVTLGLSRSTQQAGSAGKYYCSSRLQWESVKFSTCRGRGGEGGKRESRRAGRGGRRVGRGTFGGGWARCEGGEGSPAKVASRLALINCDIAPSAKMPAAGGRAGLLRAGLVLCTTCHSSLVKQQENN